MDEVLKSIYYDQKSAGSFGGIHRLYREASKQHAVTEEEVREFLSKQNSYTLHKDRKFRFKRNKIIALYKDYNWEADLIDMIAYEKENDGHKHILVAIDDFSKYAWLRAMKDKTPTSVKDAFTDIFKTDKRVPHRLRTDRGKEFENRVMDKFYHDHEILFFTTTNQTIKCAIVERLNRTLKSRFFRYFTSKGSHRYIDVLQDFADSYNTSYHRSIKMTPKEACEAETATVFANLYEGKTLKELLEKKEKPAAVEGDLVRIQYDKDTFDKSYFSTFTDQTATVKRVIGKPIPMYSLLDYRKKPIPRNFYKSEIQPIPEPSYRIERILRERQRGGKTEYFVKFLNYPSSENAWVTDIGNV